MKKLCLIVLVTITVLVGGCAKSSTQDQTDQVSTKTNKQGPKPPKEVVLKYEAEPAVSVEIASPLKGMAQIKSLPIESAGRKLTLELWAGADVQNKGGALQGYLTDGGKTYNLGPLGPYMATNKYEVKPQDINADGVSDLLVSIDAGGSAMESNIFTYDSAGANWVKVLNAPDFVFKDLDGDGKEEVMGITRKVDPEKLWLYKEENGAWGKADIVALSKQYYAKLVQNQDEAKLQLGQDPKKPYTYVLKDDKLVLTD